MSTIWSSDVTKISNNVYDQNAYSYSSLFSYIKAINRNNPETVIKHTDPGM
jgi:hypothetical protein